ncbi:hypothetical protein PV325_007580, partial [Microctonus aethiopoides]
IELCRLDHNYSDKFGSPVAPSQCFQAGYTLGERIYSYKFGRKCLGVRCEICFTVHTGRTNANEFLRRHSVIFAGVAVKPSTLENRPTNSAEFSFDVPPGERTQANANKNVRRCFSGRPH